MARTHVPTKETWRGTLEKGLSALHLELQPLCELFPNPGSSAAAGGAGAFLALRFSSACPFYCAITESIKHPFETPWTSADTQTGVGWRFFCYFRYYSRQTCREGIRVPARAGPEGGREVRLPVGRPCVLCGLRTPRQARPRRGPLLQGDAISKGTLRKKSRGVRIGSAFPTSVGWAGAAGDYFLRGEKKTFLNRLTWERFFFFFFFGSALSISGIKGLCQEAGSQAELGTCVCVARENLGGGVGGGTEMSLSICWCLGGRKYWNRNRKSENRLGAKPERVLYLKGNVRLIV